MKIWFPSQDESDFEETNNYFNFLAGFICLCFVPGLGLLADKYLLHSQMSIFSPLVAQISLILYMVANPYVGCIFFGASFALNYTGVWSNVSYCVSDFDMVFFFNKGEVKIDNNF